MSMARRSKAKDELLAIANIGPAMRADLKRLGIDTVAQLAKQDPDTLYARLNRLTGRRHDPCVWDTFAAAIHHAKTGEAKEWWLWTKARKRRQAAGQFVPTDAMLK
jgi:nucleotidyltransferase/DNA polymerase involved in DNA repair